MSIFSLITGGAFKLVRDIIRDLAAGKISEEEARAKIAVAENQSRADIEKAWADSAASQYESWQASVRSSRVLQNTVAAMIVVELMVLLFWQIGVPYLEFIGYTWPQPDITLEWAYALIAGSTGVAALLRR